LANSLNQIQIIPEDGESQQIGASGQVMSYRRWPYSSKSERRTQEIGEHPSNHQAMEPVKADHRQGE